MRSLLVKTLVCLAFAGWTVFLALLAANEASYQQSANPELGDISTITNRDKAIVRARQILRECQAGKIDNANVLITLAVDYHFLPDEVGSSMEDFGHYREQAIKQRARQWLIKARTLDHDAPQVLEINYQKELNSIGSSSWEIWFWKLFANH